MIKKLLLLGFLALVGMGVMFSYHESAHYAIYSYTDSCEKITFSFNWLTFNTNCHGYVANTLETELNLWNEIIGYVMVAFVGNLWLMLIFITVTKQTRKVR